jgi:hypothetical protein
MTPRSAITSPAKNARANIAFQASPANVVKRNSTGQKASPSAASCAKRVSGSALPARRSRVAIAPGTQMTATPAAAPSARSMARV